MSWIHAFRHRLKVRLDPQAYERERREELRVHKAMDAIHDRSARGAHARGAPGFTPAPHHPHPDQEPHPMRLPLIDWLRQDLAYALRGIARSPGFTAMVVVTLALGVGANAAVFSLLDRVFGQAPAGVSEPGELRRLYVQFPDHPVEPGRISPAFNVQAVTALMETPPASELAAWSSSTAFVRQGEAGLTVSASWVTSDFFSVLGVNAVRGRLFGPEEERLDVPAPVVVISYGLWERAFGLDPAIVGRSLEVGDGLYSIVGITPRDFSGLEVGRTDIFLPLSTLPDPSSRRSWYEGTGSFLRVIVQLSGTTSDGALEDAATFAYRNRQDLPDGGSPDSTAVVLAGSIIEGRGPGRLDQAASISLRVAGITAIVLLIACANVAGLLLVHATRRRREIAIRLALGVSRARLVGQLITESLVLAAIAGAAAVLLAGWGGMALRRLLMPSVDWAQPAVELRTIAFALGTAGLAGLLAGLAPALNARHVDMHQALKAGPREYMARRSRARAGLLAAQAALSVVLLVGAALFVRSLGSVTALPVGYDIDEVAFGTVVLIPAPSHQGEALAEVASRIANHPGVSGVALATSAPMYGYGQRVLSLPGRDSLPRLRADETPTYNVVSPEFFAVSGVSMVDGREFEAGDGGEVVIVNETMARTFWPGERAVGQCLIVGDPDEACSEVIGVAADARRSRIIEEATLQYFLPLAPPAQPASVVLRVRRGQWPAVASLLRAELDRHFEPQAVRVERLSDALEPQLRPWRLGAQLFTAFGVLALLITVVGLYSVMAYSVSQRTREMGVRIALGARAADVLRLVVGEGLGVLAIGLVLGIGIALALGRLVESLLFGVTPRDPVAMAAAAAVLLVAGVTASVLPAWRATQVDPVTSLSSE
jgi:predicted permease